VSKDDRGELAEDIKYEWWYRATSTPPFRRCAPAIEKALLQTTAIVGKHPNIPLRSPYSFRVQAYELLDWSFPRMVRDVMDEIFTCDFVWDKDGPRLENIPDPSNRSWYRDWKELTYWY
jgi:hypothetical protein